MSIEKRVKAYNIRLTEEENEVFKSLGKKYNLSNMIREFVMKLWEDEKSIK